MKFRIFILLGIAAGITLPLLTFSCTQTPIFASIEHEVKLKDFSVKGPIRGIALKGTELYAATPEKVFSKAKDSNGEWKEIGSPGYLLQTLTVIGNKLFASTLDGTAYYNDSGWVKIPGGDKVIVSGGSTKLFGYNRDEKKVYEITDSSVILRHTFTENKTFVGAGGDYFVFTDKVYKAGTGTTSTEVASSPSEALAACGDGSTGVFVLTYYAVHHYNGTSWTSTAISIEHPISLSLFKNGSTNKLLIGSRKGYAEVNLASTTSLTGAVYLSAGSLGSTTPPEVSAQYSSSAGSYAMEPVFAVKTSTGYSVFAGIHAGSIERHTGLWGFYSADRPQWNRE